MAYIERSTRASRSLGASLFWGLVSVFFAAAACFYYWKDHGSEVTANVMRDQVMELREENESLASQKAHLQADRSDEETQLKAREDLVAEKETELAAEETHLDGLSQQTQNQSQQTVSQTAMVRKFNDVIRKLSKSAPADVVERGGRPVLRVPNSALFAPGDAALTADGRTMLMQFAQAVGTELDGFELRLETYTDADAEAAVPVVKTEDDGKPRDLKCWDLTSARASALALFLRDRTQLPFANLLVVSRGDSDPISRTDHTRNRRVEITVAPLPVPYHAESDDKTATAAADPAVSSQAPAAPAAPKEKPKAKSKAKTANPQTTTEAK